MAGEKVIMYRDEGGSSSILEGYPPNPCKNLSGVRKTGEAILSWEDPDDLTLTTGEIVVWAKSILVRKVGSYPENENDGTVVVSNSVRNQYASGYTDTGLTNGVTYYYRVFSVSDDGAVNRETGVQIDITPVLYKTMTVNIDLLNSNPATWGTYADDAVGMESGKTDTAITEWQKFFGYKPCLLCNGEVLGYLQNNNFWYYEDGSAAPITIGNDTMIEFPRRGLKISTVGNVLSISMTDDPDNPDFTYYAHTTNTGLVDCFYLGAYLSYYSYSKIYSMPNQKIEYNSSFVSYAKNKGDGYIVEGFYQHVYIQAMYLLQFMGNTDASTILGAGYTQDVSTPGGTGTTATCPLIYGSSDKSTHVKLFGLEDIYGNLYCGLLNAKILCSNNVIHLYTRMHESDDYVYRCVLRSAIGSSGGYIKSVIGTSESGFLPTEYEGSNTTYFTDYGGLGLTGTKPWFLYVGGEFNQGSGYKHYGIFHVRNTTDNIYEFPKKDNVACRLMYM